MASSKLMRVAFFVALPVLAGGSVLAGCGGPPPRTPDCGDSFLDEDYGEECDDGNEAFGDGCAPVLCTIEPMWECMDATPLDGVPGTCRSLRCGDMRVTGTEVCDSGGVATATCDVDCTAPLCGDGLLNRMAGEGCDDDNVMPGDGCTPVCIFEPASCGNDLCELDGEETCDNCMGDCASDPTCNGCTDGDGDGYYDVTCGGNDCDDAEASIHPDAEDILCNGIDDDCSAATSGTVDADTDGWRCGLDCDDANALISPSTMEVCADDIDNDCNPVTLDVDDADGDGADCMIDCDESNPMIAPGLREICNNGVNDDCDMLGTPDVADLDGDGFACNHPSECDDYREDVHVGVAEIACDGANNDCSLSTPDRPDLDLDTVTSCEMMDCDDTNRLRSPLLTEICGNGIDDDCSAATPDSQDIDGDMFDCAVDCDDTDATIYPDPAGRCGARILFAYDFDTDGEGWTTSIGSPTRVTSWAWGVPSGPTKAHITGCAGGSTGCWVTALTTDHLNNELGYVTSPPMDMSGGTVDPSISFGHIFEIQASLDQSWIEMSIDGGMTWTKLGRSGEGQNWYSDTVNQNWSGTSGAPGAWRTASTVLTGAAGEADVRVRFVFQSNIATVRDGVAFDDVVIDNQQIDASVTNVTINRASCGPSGSVDVTVTNLGQVVIPSYDVSLVVEGGAPVVQNVMAPLVVGATAVINFPSVAYAMEPTSVTATVIALDDGSPGNDAVTRGRTCVGAFPIPFAPVPTTGATLSVSDDGSVSQPIGFPFRFFENTYSNVIIGSNGFLAFTATGSGCCEGGLIPSPTDGGLNNMIAVAWNDLNTASGGTIRYETRGTAPNRTFVVSYNAVAWFGGGGNVTTQVILHESGRIQVFTTSLSMGASGQDYTQGVENLAGTVAYFLPGRVNFTAPLMNDGIEYVTY